MCRFCNETNWTGIAKGDLVYNCSDYTAEERANCNTLLEKKDFLDVIKTVVK